eukprot:gnl/MRDRNA2_/MRDRNA2_18887_c0_seq1.p1 gnl/MRDRNA2_/MRDRNA2_18887_c0~~gnl/MRDRNA2_/MRDRNA2_18887_c0_seq1.p1  ORF type:complete len:431 (+),score=71.47 gnl/MRDRNA2_/MRDRNA2_18887_c0_seq1:68-1360(+)
MMTMLALKVILTCSVCCLCRSQRVKSMRKLRTNRFLQNQAPLKWFASIPRYIFASSRSRAEVGLSQNPWETISQLLTTLGFTAARKSVILRAHFTMSSHHKCVVQTVRAEGDVEGSYRAAVPVEDEELTLGMTEGKLLKDAPHLPWPAPSTEALREEGVVLIPDLVSKATATALLAHCKSKLAENLAAIATGEGSYSEYFGTVRARCERHDLKLALDPVVADALAESLEVLGPLLRGALECDEPYLAALGAVGSMEDAPRQTMHSDTRCFDSAKLLTIFIALQDIDEQMGPTTFLPGTHNAQAHAAMKESALHADLLSTGPIRLGTMPIGASTVYDTRLLHAGGANNSPRERWLFYATFAASRKLADEYHGEEYGELQRAAHTVSSLHLGTGGRKTDRQTETESLAGEAEDMATMWAALKRMETQDNSPT